MIKQRIVFRIETFPEKYQGLLAILPDMELEKDGAYQAWSSREGFVSAQRKYIWDKTKPCPKDAFPEEKARILDMYEHPEKYPWKDDEPIKLVERKRITSRSF